MGLMDSIWDDTLGGPEPEMGMKMGKRSSMDSGDSPRMPLPSTSSSPSEDSAMSATRRVETTGGDDDGRQVSQTIAITKPPMSRATSLPTAFSGSPGSPGLVSPGGLRTEDNIWRSVFHPGSNKAGMDGVHAGHKGRWDNADAKEPSVFDWMYNPKTRSQYR